MQERRGSWPWPVTWGPGEVLVVAFLWTFFWPAAAREALAAIGFFRWHYGPEAALVLSSPAQRQAQKTGLALLAGPAAAESFDEPLAEARQRLGNRFNLWALALAFPFQLATMLAIPYAVSRTRPQQLGLTTRRLGRNLLAGLITGLLLTPAVLGVFAAVLLLCEHGLPGKVHEHALTVLMRTGLSGGEWTLLVFAAVVAAPVLEELIFRGLLQPWLGTRPWGGQAGVALALALALAACGTDVLAARHREWTVILDAAAPALFVLAMIPIFLIAFRRHSTQEARAVFGTALAFAALHSSVWPTPIPLFVLGLGLGELARRTGSLVGPIVVHSLFNGLNVLVFLARPPQ